VLQNEGLKAAWQSAGAGAAAGLTPATMLAEIQKLKAAGSGEDLLIQWIGGQTLRSPFSTEDVLAWKAAGIEEAVIRAAMARPVAGRTP